MSNGVVFTEAFYSMGEQGKIEKSEKKTSKVNLLKVLFVYRINQRWINQFLSHVQEVLARVQKCFLQEQG